METKENLPTFDFKPDYELGQILANRKIEATKTGLEESYNRDIRLLVNQELSEDYQQGKLMAQLLNEGARRAVLRYSWFFVVYSLVGYTAALMVGFKPKESALVLPVSATLSILSLVRYE